jgi:hypothetical protein
LCAQQSLRLHNEVEEAVAFTAGVVVARAFTVVVPFTAAVVAQASTAVVVASVRAVASQGEAFVLAVRRLPA